LRHNAVNLDVDAVIWYDCTPNPLRLKTSLNVQSNDPNPVVLRCQTCGTNHDPGLPIWACPCGGLLDAVMPAVFPWEAMQERPAGLWRYRAAMALPAAARPVSLGEMRTPLLAVEDAASRLHLKLDFLFPTGSFKDRGAAVMLTHVRNLGVTNVVEDSSGNAGAAVAAYAAAAGIAATIYVPASARPAKTAQITLYGARLVRVPGSRAATTESVQAEARRTYYASHVWNPFFLEGTKTVAFEIWEQLGQRAPEWVITPVGHGTMLLGLYIGFDHLRRAGVIGRLPRIVGVQAANVAPLAAAAERGGTFLPEITTADTLADGIAIAQPVRWRQILAAITASDGKIVTVSEQEIRQATAAWAHRGILMEPTSASALAAYMQLCRSGSIDKSATVVVPVTGSGIKSAERILIENLTKPEASGILA
jgi:threonine synthase